jgi:Raf kinase inhibitor-like YbhB/YbcL family protein
MRAVLAALVFLPLGLPTTALLHVHSRAFAADEAVPAAYLCSSDARTPPLYWSHVPDGTRSFVVVIDDPAPRRSFVHFIAYNLPPTVHELDGELPATAIVGLNSDGRPGYAAPCPTEGMHFFRFKVFALDAMLPSFAVPSDDRITTAMSGHILAAGEMVGAWIH